MVNPKALVAAGFGLMAAALAAGAFTSISSGTGFGAAWFAVSGAGLGLAMPSAMNAALGALSAERSGAGSSLIQALRQVGATLGAAILGTVLSSAYQARLDVTGLPAAAADAAKSGVSGGVEVARSLGSASAAALGGGRVRARHGRDAVVLRGHRAGRRPAGAGLPAAPDARRSRPRPVSPLPFRRPRGQNDDHERGTGHGQTRRAA